MSNKVLLPCPFCGGKAYMWTCNDTLTIECEHYHADNHRVMMSGHYGGDIIDAWNRRATGKCDCNEKMIFTGDDIVIHENAEGTVFYNVKIAAYQICLTQGIDIEPGECVPLEGESEEYRLV